MRPLLLLLPLTLGAAAPAAPSAERSFFVPSFEGMRVYGPFEVEVVPGAPRVVATGDAVALTRLAARVDSGLLVLNTGATGFEQRQRDTPGAVRIRVSVPALRSVVANGGATIRVAQMAAPRVSLGLNGTGAMTVGGLRAESLDVTHTGNGLLTLGGTAITVRLRAVGGGSVDASGLTAREASVAWQSRGTLRIGVRYAAEVSAGAGAVEILGKPDCRLSGTAPVTCLGTVTRR